MTSTPPLQNPLEGFNKLADRTHLYRPAIQTTASEAPELVIICSWAFAREKHIAKYLKGYKQLYPNARILLLQSLFSNMVWRPEFMQMPLFQPALLAIRDYLESMENRSPRILLHIFSNGGSYTAVQLAQAYKQASFTNNQNLPVSAILFDSTPGIPPYADGIKAVSMGMPKTLFGQWIGVPMVYVVVGTLGLLNELGLMEIAHHKLWREFNNIDGAFLSSKIPRSYIYSETDQMIRSSHVERHAEAAKERLEEIGLSASDASSLVKLEKFDGSAHVNHISVDAERYWKVVGGTWNRARNSD